SPILIEEPILDEPSRVMRADFNNDGMDELVVSATVMSAFREVVGFHIYDNDGDRLQLQQTIPSTNPDIADLNGDGFLDIVSIENRVPVVHWNKGDGTFGARRTLGVSSGDRFTSYRQIEAGDFDGDGDTDLAFMVSKLPLDFRGIAISYNDGNGKFSPLDESIYLDDLGPSYTVGDFDSDGDDDIATYSRVSGVSGDQLVWHERTAGNTFLPHAVDSGVQSSSSELRTEDIDGNGTLEVILQNDAVRWTTGDESTAVFAYSPASGTIFKQDLPEELNNAKNLLFVDVDGDNDIDVLRQDQTELRLFTRDDGGLTARDVVYNSPAAISDVTILNLDNDGEPDFAMVSQSFDVLAVGKHNGDNTFSVNTLSQSNVDNVQRIDGGDVNGDGRNDLLVAGESLALYTASPVAGDFDLPITLMTEPVNSSELVDFDQDGDLDVVASSNSRLAWFENRRGDFALHRLAEHGLGVAVLDFDNDSLLDVVYSTPDSADLVFLRNAGGQFVERHRIHVPEIEFEGTILPSRFASGSLLEDLQMHELQVASLRDRGNVLAINFSQDGWEHFGVMLVPISPDGIPQVPKLAAFTFSDNDTVTMGVGDLNRDGNDDIMITTSEESAASDWIDMSNPDAPASHVVQRCSPECYAISTNLHDVDGDGDLDSIGTWAWFENIDGNATKFARHQLNGPTFRSLTAFFDIDGDNKNDVVAANDNRISWLRNESQQSDWNGDGLFNDLDIRFIDRAIRSGQASNEFDFDENGNVDNHDFYVYLRNYVGYSLFDVNLDGRFNSSDLVTLFQAAKYEKDEPATWSEGDFDGDGRFDSSDIIDAFAFGYERDPFDAD
ncbi:MAG: VCBS repeat-containing protein, partial [Planctomycetales bacterium]|nr:VCBS repeat-containing protein [Planctomycetales bacterium]